jgi:dTDP-4-amino-4,6-dideoxygalactose transaminase
MINVTKTFLPPLEEYISQVQRAYQNEWITNRGELVLELELRIKDFLQLEKSKILITTNGTVPLQMALKLVGMQGEVITTPFSYVATTAAIIWENCKPVFVDIHPEYLTIDETKIESAITDKTTCILATHVFGNPCNIEEIERIAKKYNLKVIYDAAHSFGVKYKEKSVFEFGDISTCSFHATKVFHTSEGGAVFCKDLDLFHKLYYSHNFGHKGHLDFYGLGINGKMSELNAAMGLAVFPYINEILDKRKAAVNYYDKSLDFSNLSRLKIRENTQWNYSYYPVIFKSEQALKKVEMALNREHIYPRRYFYPSLNKLSFVQSKSMKISESIASRILCLPLYKDITNLELDRICKLISINVK